MANFAVILARGPRWDDSRGGIREQRLWNEHAVFMDRLVADGFIVLSGPVGDGKQTLHVVDPTTRTRSAKYLLKALGRGRACLRSHPVSPGPSG